MKHNYTFLTILVFNIIGVTAQNVVTPVGVHATTFTENLHTSIANSYNGSGLQTFPSLTANHESTAPANCFVAHEDTGTIDFDLGDTYNIDGLSIWTLNTGGPDSSIGINEVAFYTSPDGITYTAINGAPTAIAKVTTAVSPPETFSFTSVEATYIRMEILSAHDSSFMGFAEIAFSGKLASSTLGLHDSIKSKSVKLYPNPSHDYISISGIKNAKKYTIYDFTGKTTLNGFIDGNEKINIQNLNRGLYLLKLNNTDIAKFVKH